MGAAEDGRTTSRARTSARRRRDPAGRPRRAARERRGSTPARRPWGQRTRRRRWEPREPPEHDRRAAAHSAPRPRIAPTSPPSQAPGRLRCRRRRRPSLACSRLLSSSVSSGTHPGLVELSVEPHGHARLSAFIRPAPPSQLRAFVARCQALSLTAAETEMINDVQKELSASLAKSHESLRRELTKLRAGRASAALLDGIKADY